MEYGKLFNDTTINTPDVKDTARSFIKEFFKESNGMGDIFVCCKKDNCQYSFFSGGFGYFKITKRRELLENEIEESKEKYGVKYEDDYIIIFN